MISSVYIQAKAASRCLQTLPEGKAAAVLEAVADAILAEGDALLEANRLDLARMDRSNPLYDRLMLDKTRLEGIAADMRHVAALPSPLGRILDDRILPNGLHLRKVSVPFGVIGVIYEARPNVTFDVFSLCFRSGNATLLKGGRDAEQSNLAAVALIRRVLREQGVDEHAVALLPATHEAAEELLGATGYVDLVIPRGGRRLIDFVRDHAKVPCIETGAGVVNTYFDRSGDLEKGKRIVTNAKTRRVSVCNALDCLIIHHDRLQDLPELLAAIQDRVTVYADDPALESLRGKYPSERLFRADVGAYGTEYMDYKLAIRTVDSLESALDHIARHGSGHSEAIVTEDETAAARFRAEVDAACVYVNAPTSFTDGAQFDLGAEIGISTQKLGARGPMGLAEITTYKWLIDGNGQTRP